MSWPNALSLEAPPHYERAPVMTSALALAQVELAVRVLLGKYSTMPAAVMAQRVGWTGGHVGGDRCSVIDRIVHHADVIVESRQSSDLPVVLVGIAAVAISVLVRNGAATHVSRSGYPPRSTAYPRVRTASNSFVSSPRF